MMLNVLKVYAFPGWVEVQHEERGLERNLPSLTISTCKVHPERSLKRNETINSMLQTVADSY